METGQYLLHTVGKDITLRYREDSQISTVIINKDGIFKLLEPFSQRDVFHCQRSWVASGSVTGSDFFVTEKLASTVGKESPFLYSPAFRLSLAFWALSSGILGFFSLPSSSLGFWPFDLDVDGFKMFPVWFDFCAFWLEYPIQISSRELSLQFPRHLSHR